jgi:uncharacterized membrane protein
MSYTITPNEPGEQDARTLTLACYILYACIFCAMIPPIIAIIINYVKKDDITDPVYASHFKWQIRTFWWGLLWYCVSFVLAFILIGFVGLFAVTVWYIYRIVKGVLRWSDGRGMYEQVEMRV